MPGQRDRMFGQISRADGRPSPINPTISCLWRWPGWGSDAFSGGGGVEVDSRLGREGGVAAAGSRQLWGDAWPAVTPETAFQLTRRCFLALIRIIAGPLSSPSVLLFLL